MKVVRFFCPLSCDADIFVCVSGNLPVYSINVYIGKMDGYYKVSGPLLRSLTGAVLSVLPVLSVFPALSVLPALPVLPVLPVLSILSALSVLPVLPALTILPVPLLFPVLSNIVLENNNG